MRNPRLWRNVGLTLAAAGPVAIVAALQLPPGALTDTPRAIGFIFGMMAILFGGTGALVMHFGARAQAALERGEDIIARWRVEAATWRDFIALNRELDQAPDAHANELSIREEVPADGIAVVVGKSAIDVDGSLHRLPLRGTPEITGVEFNESRIRPSYIEMALYYPGGGPGDSGVPQAPTRTCLRFPVPPGAQSDAERVVAHYRSGSATPDFFHGRGDGSDAEDLSKCWSCGFETYRFQSHCPKCGSVLQSRRWSRRLGGLTVLCGVVIVGIVGTVLYFTTPLLLHPGVEIDGTRFDGTPQFALGVLGLLGVVFAFGMIALLYGAWQMKTGKRNKKVVSIMTGIVSLLMFAAWLIR